MTGVTGCAYSSAWVDNCFLCVPYGQRKYTRRKAVIPVITRRGNFMISKKNKEKSDQ